MRDVIVGRLWLGTSADARDLPGLYDRGVLAVVDLAAEESPAHLARDIIYCRFPLLDGGENTDQIVRAAIAATATLIEQHIPSLVACAAGMSRSPAVVAAALAIHQGDSPDSCLKRLVANHPHDVSPQLWVSAIEACEAIRASLRKPS